MSLAIAEILFKQTGSSSLDKARAQHRHHGLTLRVENTPQDSNLETASSSLIATPALRQNGERFGTFELWHRSCREMPICGIVSSIHHAVGGTSTAFRALLTSEDVRLRVVPEKGLNLYECLRSLPGMLNFLASFGIIPRLVRGVLTATGNVSSPTPSPLPLTYNLVIHPGMPDVVQSFYDNIMVRGDIIDHFDLRELPSGGIITITMDERVTPPRAFHIPNGTMWRKSEIRFRPTLDEPLNEFGYLYVEGSSRCPRFVNI